MKFYNIIWLTIFISSGVSLVILGLLELNYFPLILVNSQILEHMTIPLEKWSLNLPVNRALTISIEAEADS